MQDLEKSSIVAVAWVVVIIVVTFFSTVNSRLLLLSVFPSPQVLAIILYLVLTPAGYQDRLIAYAFCKVGGQPK